MQQSFIKIYENENGDVVLTYADSELFDANDTINPQSITISNDDIMSVVKMLSEHSEQNS